MADYHAARLDRFRALLRRRDLDAALVTSPVNVRYLSGVALPGAALLLVGERLLVAVDGNGERPSDEYETLLDPAPAVALTARAARDGLRRLAFEDHDVTVEGHGALAAVRGALTLVPLRRAVEELRQVKDEWEIGCLRQACAIVDQAMADMLESMLVGRAERHIAQELERRLLDHGADPMAVAAVVASGPHTARPRHVATDRRVAVGDLVTLDVAAAYRGYHADITRTVVVGAEPADWQVALYDVVFAAQKAGREALLPGAEYAAVDQAARRVIRDAGYPVAFRDDTVGHGVGLAIPEEPFLGAGRRGKLAARTLVTVEPGVCLPGRGGVRIEDTLVVRPVQDGGPELLTITTKELLVL
jgi:Xaa-Pro aminopeptidase